MCEVLEISWEFSFKRISQFHLFFIFFFKFKKKNEIKKFLKKKIFLGKKKIFLQVKKKIIFL